MSLRENRWGMGEMLGVMGIGPWGRIWEKGVSAGLVSSALSAPAGVLLCLRLGFAGAALWGLTIFNGFLSGLLCALCSASAHSFRGENAAKAMIALTSLLLQLSALAVIEHI